MSDSVAFTKALIRACKHRVSGRHVDFKWVVGQVAALDTKFVTDEDVANHFAEALLDLAVVGDRERGVLRDSLRAAMLSDDVRAHAVSKLAHTRVEYLREIGLWDDEVVS